MNDIRFVHTNIVAKDWRRLVAFYVEVFDCEVVPPERDLSGAWLDDLTGIPNARIRGAHIRLPGYDGHGPTLEIFSYAPELARHLDAKITAIDFLEEFLSRGTSHCRS